MDGRSGYRLLRRLPGDTRGSFLDEGTLEYCRETLGWYAATSGFPDGTLLYIVTPSRTIYEGYEVVGGDIVKNYVKYPSRSGSGGYSEIGWG